MMPKTSSSYYNNLKNVDSKDVYNQLPEYTRVSRYAQHNAKMNRRENWSEQTDRVFKMHKVKFAQFLDDEKFNEVFTFAKNMVLNKNVLGSQRALQFGGPAVLNKNTRIYNCAATYIDRPRVFQEIMFTLLCGVGIGFSVQKHHIENLPYLLNPCEDYVVTFVIPDSIEGWAESVGVLLSSYFINDGACDEKQIDYYGQYEEKYFGKTVKFDYSLIRQKVSSISHMGGKAPGPEGLKNSLEKVITILDECVKSAEMENCRYCTSERKGNEHLLGTQPDRACTCHKLSTIQCYDMIMHISDAVLSGGIRRSATLCLFSLDDEDMINSKTGDWYIKNPQRARSNNSALLLRDKIPEEKYMKLIESVKQF